MSKSLFPARDVRLGDAPLKRELVATGVSTDTAKHATILLKSELDILQGLASGSFTATRGFNAPTGRDAGLLSSPERKQAAADRKARMMALDEERRAKGQVASAEDMERAVLRSQQVETARRKQDEDLDEVKHINRVMQYAKCVTVRDAQVLEKKAISAERSEEERRQDMMMELERLKALRMYEEREAKRNEDLRRGAAVIRAQIEEREQERLRRIELRQQEQEAMVRHIGRMRDEDRGAAQRKKENARRLMEDVALANAEQIRLKAKQQEMEIEEDRQIADYIKEKERREQDNADEQAHIKAEKEREVARLRSMQERVHDRRAEQDAVRARRAQEAYDREERAKDRMNKERTQAINDDLANAREHQRHEREILLAEQARQEQEEFDRIVAVQKRAEEQDRLRRERENEMRKQNALSLRKQITEVEEQRRKDRREQLEEGQRFEMEKRDRAATVDSIRHRKMEELERLQVPAQYRQELLKKRDAERLRPTK